MSALTIQLSGAESGIHAQNLGQILRDDLGPEAVGSVEQLRTADPIALINVVLAGISSAAAVASSAHVVWQWWQGVKTKDINIVFERSDGSRLEFTGDITKEQIEAVMAGMNDTQGAAGNA